MGYYVNSNGLTKEQWLGEHKVAVSIKAPDQFPPSDTKMAYVCLVDNGPFTAAAIAYSKQELVEFAEEDGRPKIWYTVPRAALVAIGAIKDEVFKY